MHENYENNENNYNNTPAAPKKKSHFLPMLALAFICIASGICFGRYIIPNLSSPIEKVNKVHSPTATVIYKQTEVKSDEAPRYAASQIYSNNIDSVVAINTEITTRNIFGQSVLAAAAGSGFVVSEDGYILTNYHVVNGANSIKVLFSDETSIDAELIGFEVDNDIAVLKVDKKGLKPVVLGDSDNLVVGEPVYAVGNPLGELTFSMTGGMVSALDRDIRTDEATTINMFQVDCAINEGNSGGPIFNEAGEVIGIATAKYASDVIEGLGFCIPVNDITAILEDLISYGSVQNKAYMGIQVSDVSAMLVTQYKMKEGAYVQSIESGSCAEKAGLKIGDIIVELGDKNVSNVSELLSAKRAYRAGDTTSITVYRAGETQSMNITFDEEPENVDPPQEIEITPNNPDTTLEIPQENQFSIEDFYNYFGQFFPQGE